MTGIVIHTLVSRLCMFYAFSFFFRIQKQEVEADFKREMAKVKEAKAYVSKHPDLKNQMEEFLQVSLHYVHFSSLM